MSVGVGAAGPAAQPRRRGCRCTALREGLPYGAVMATAGAAAVAGRCGLPRLVVPLLALASAWAVWLVVAGARRHRPEFALGWRPWIEIGFASEHSGIHTVPLGVAVITGGFGDLAADPAAGRAWLAAAVVGLALTWLLTCASVARFVLALARYRLDLAAVDGAWFLVPAAALGAALATLQVTPRLAGAAALLLQWLALAAAVLGALGYWAVAAVAAVRLRRYGLAGVPRSPWWIAMGCAGLAAAALGCAVDAAIPGADWLRGPLLGAVCVFQVCAMALCVPVLAGGASFLLRGCRFRARATWPPTFSTAVFALGGLWAGKVLGNPALHAVGLGAGFATLAFWGVTVTWNVGVRFRRGARA